MEAPPKDESMSSFFLFILMPLLNAQAGSTSGGRNKWTRSPSGGPRVAYPLLEGTIDHRRRYGLVQKVQALTLMAEGFSMAHVEEKTGIPRLTLYRIKKTTRDRGFAPEQDPRVLEAYVVDRERRGRPKTITKAVEQRLLTNVREDRSSRE